MLESFGALELACLDELEPTYGSSADYVVAMDGDAHTYCSFGAYALPQLRALGWIVDIDEDYPYAAISADQPWYAALDTADDEPDWFSFELGVMVDGRRVSLLPRAARVARHHQRRSHALVAVSPPAEVRRGTNAGRSVHARP